MPTGHATNEGSNYFALGLQGGKDVEATNFYFLRHLSGTGLEMDTQTESVKEGGDGQEVGLRYKTSVSLDGAAIANSRPEWAVKIFSYGLGAATAIAPPVGLGGNASGVCQLYTSYAVASQPYLTADQGYADQVERVRSAQVTELLIEGEAGRPIKITANLIGGGTPYAPTVALTPTRETGQPFFYPGGSYVLTNASGAKMTKFSAKLTRSSDADIRTTQLYREDVLPLAFDTTLDCTLKYEDAGLYDLAQYDASKLFISNDLATMSFQAVQSFGAGTNQRFMEINFPVMHITGAKVNKLDPDGKTMYIDAALAGLKGATYQMFTRVLAPSGVATTVFS